MAKVDSSLGLKDTMPFGKKHKGKQVETILVEDPGYLLWLRDKRLEDNKDAEFFNKEVLDLLDQVLVTNRRLANQHKQWSAMVPATAGAAPAMSAAPAPSDAYAGAWGAF